MDDTAVTNLEAALTDILSKIETASSQIDSIVSQRDALNSQLDALNKNLTNYRAIRDDIIASIELLTSEEVDPEHPDQEEELTPVDPDAVDDNDYGDFEYA